MEQRKLIRLGNSSFAIALPKDWVDKSGLKKGDNIFIYQNGNGELTVHPTLQKEIEGSIKTLNLENKNQEEIARDLIAAYVGGSKLIEAVGEKSQLKIAKTKAKNFLNLEPIEEATNKILFKDLLDIENISLDNFIKRMDNNIQEMFSALSNTLKEKKKFKENARDLEQIDEDVTKFYFLVWRLVNLGIDNPSVQANLKIGPKSFILYFWLSYNLEQMGDELKRIARKIEDVQNKELAKEVMDLVSLQHAKSMKSFFERNKELAKEVILAKDNIIDLCENLAKEKNSELIAEKLKKIMLDIHHNSKIVFYNL